MAGCKGFLRSPQCINRGRLGLSRRALTTFTGKAVRRPVQARCSSHNQAGHHSAQGNKEQPDPVFEEWQQIQRAFDSSAASSSGRDPCDIWTDAAPPSAVPDTLPYHEQFSYTRGLWSLQKGSGFAVESPSWDDLSHVYVILFGVGEADTEGIYSLRAVTREDALPQDTIIAFVNAEDAERYAGLLEATMDHVPKVCPIEPQELLDFCDDSGYRCRLEACGSLLIPPDYNVSVTDWERSLRLRDGAWSVLSEDPTRTPLDALAPQEFEEQHSDPRFSQLHNNAGYYNGEHISDAELQDMKARLERLLPKDSGFL